MFWKRLRTAKALDADRQVKRAHCEKIAADAGFELSRYESGNSFDNIVLDIRRGTLLLRFVRDRGYASCDVRSALMPPAEEWVDYDALGRMLGLRSIDLHDDFDALLSRTLHSANAQAIDELERLTENRDRYSKMSHGAISLLRARSPFHTTE